MCNGVHVDPNGSRIRPACDPITSRSEGVAAWHTGAVTGPDRKPTRRCSGHVRRPQIQRLNRTAPMLPTTATQRRSAGGRMARDLDTRSAIAIFGERSAQVVGEAVASA